MEGSGYRNWYIKVMSKRGASEQITRENLKDDYEEVSDVSHKATSAVMAKRKILKPKGRSAGGTNGFSFKTSEVPSSGLFGSTFKSKAEPSIQRQSEEEGKKVDDFNEKVKALNENFIQHLTENNKPNTIGDFSAVCRKYIEYYENISKESNGSVGKGAPVFQDSSAGFNVSGDKESAQETSKPSFSPFSGTNGVNSSKALSGDGIFNSSGIKSDAKSLFNFSNSSIKAAQPQDSSAIKAPSSAFTFQPAKFNHNSANVETKEGGISQARSLFGNDTQNDKTKPPISFGSNNSDVSMTSAFKFGGDSKEATEEKDIKPAFSFDSASNQSSKPAVSLGNNANDTSKPVLTFGSANREPSKPAFSFGETNKNTHSGSVSEKATQDASKSIFSFGNSNKDASKPVFSFGDKSNDASKSAFSFGDKSKDSSTPAFSFNNTDKDVTKPAFTFNSSTAAEGIAPSFDAKKEEKSSEKAPVFTFGTSGATKLDGKNNNYNANGSTNQGFQFGTASQLDGAGESKSSSSVKEESAEKASNPFSSKNSVFNFSSKSSAEVQQDPSNDKKISPAEEKDSNETAEEDTGANFDPVAKLSNEKIESQTGEEDEETLFEKRSKLMLLDVSNKENPYIAKGLGDLKVLRNKTTNKTRVLVRSEGSQRVLLNILLNKDMAYDIMGNGSLVKVPTVNPTTKAVEVYVLKVKTADDGSSLSKILQEYK